jgi:hypothetical protein
VLLPFIVPTVLSAIAFWWIYDSQFSIISWSLMKIGLIDHLHQLPGRPVECALLGHRANVWRGMPFVAISLLAGLQTISPSLYEAAASTAPRPGSASAERHAAAADADHRGGDDLLGAVHLHRLPADLCADARRPGERHRI